MRSEVADRLACPTCRHPVGVEADELECTNCRRRFPLVRGVPVFTGKAGAVEVRPDDHESHQPSAGVLDAFVGCSQPWLHLGAGATKARYANSIELETAIFRYTDVVGDVAALPFADASLGGVLALNVFEHLEDPEASAEELFRVLEPGATVLIQTAFLQPLHADPFHYYNATEKGIERWFRRFDVQSIGIPGNFNPVFMFAWCASELLHGLPDEVAGVLKDLTLEELASLWRDPALRCGEAWEAFFALAQERQRILAAGFELRAVRP